MRLTTRISRVLVCLLMFTLLSPSVWAANDNTPVGVWRTYDEDNTPRSILRISEAGDQLQGRVIRSLPTKGQLPTDRCMKCTDSRQGQLVQGMVVLSGLRQDGDKWKDGWILDPYTGKSYRCIVSVSDDDQTLFMHAYVGVPALGRTIEWKRIH